MSIQLAKVLLRCQDERWKIIFKAVLDAASMTWTWPEAIHPKTGGGCMGDGDHGWAAAEFISLFRDMFVFEKQESLHLGAGLFCEWLDNLGRIELKNASTLYGTVSYSIKKKGSDLQLSWNITRNGLQDKVPIYFICVSLLKNYSVANNCLISSDKNRIKLANDTGSCLFRLNP